MAFDVLVKNGVVYDGTGAPALRADIGIVGGRFAALGRLDGEARQIINATGLAVAPGLIDLHSHSDASFLIDPEAQSKVRQGVTVELTGNCGISLCAPLIGEAKHPAQERLQMYNASVPLDWTTFAEYLERLEQAGATLNQATQVGHSTVRMAVLGYEERAPSPQELDAMRRLVAESLDAGAMGFSTGLWFPPGSYARTDEIIDLGREAVRRGKLYSTHIRDEGDTTVSLMGAVEEAIAIGRRAGARVQISHLKCSGPPVWGQADRLLGRIDRARGEGVDVAADQYPYTASSGPIADALLPGWAQAGGRQALLKGLQDADFRARLRRGLEENFRENDTPEAVVIANYPPRRELEGLNLLQVGERLGCDFIEAIMRLVQEGTGTVVRHRLQEADVEVIAAHPLVAVGSDGFSYKTSGPLSIGKPHPRSYGTFPRFLARYVRERKVTPLEEAVRKMTYLPAQRLGLSHRGRIAPGYWADLVVFNPGTVRDTATFEEPHRYPEGIPHVVVNGAPVTLNGQFTGAKPGRVLKKSDD